MEIGIIGLPKSGKSTLFKIMTGVDSSLSYGEKSIRGIAKIPDERFNRLVSIFKPAKISPASIPFIDINAGDRDAWEDIRQSLSNVDGLVHVVDCFSKTLDESIKSYKKLFDELLFSDLIMVENKLARLDKLQKKLLKPEENLQIKILPKAKEMLESGVPLRDLKLSQDEYNSLKGFRFWTIRPELIVLNAGEDNLNMMDEFVKLTNVKSPVVSICCRAEMEITELPHEERHEFLKSMGIEVAAFEKIIQRSFSLLERIVYFTVGEDEVKAWVIVKGSTAPRAASAIHKDFERGFIKAEVVSYDDFMAFGKSLQGAKSSGRLRLEGKEYIVQDGDIISFRFNV